MPGRCLVAGCSSSRRKFDRWRKGDCGTTPGRSHAPNCGCVPPFNMHVFPSPHVQGGLNRMLWAELALGSPLAATKSHMHVCSLHMRHGSGAKLPTVNIGRSENEVREILTKYGVDPDHEFSLTPIAETRTTANDECASATCNISSGASVQFESLAFLPPLLNCANIDYPVSANENQLNRLVEKDDDFQIAHNLCQQIQTLCNKLPVEFCLYIAPKHGPVYKHTSMTSVTQFMTHVEARQHIDISLEELEKRGSVENKDLIKERPNPSPFISVNDYSSGISDESRATPMTVKLEPQTQPQGEQANSTICDQTQRKKRKLENSKQNELNDEQLEILNKLSEISCVHQMNFGLILSPQDINQPVLQYSNDLNFELFMQSIRTRQFVDISLQGPAFYSQNAL